MTDALGGLSTEAVNPRTIEIDLLGAGDLVAVLHAENSTPFHAVEAALPQIAAAVELIAQGLAAGGRLIYVGAGTSGRLGVLDASECMPTFGVSPDVVVGIIAGGDAALRSSIEGAEDDEAAGCAAANTLSLTSADILVGIAASGRTPYVLGALRAAGAAGSGTVAVVNVEGSEMSTVAEMTVAAVTGPEPITGSTRLLAGTAQKMVLNLLSTGAMVLLGKTYGNLMVDVRATNHKLRTRAVRLVARIAEVEVLAARSALLQCDWEVKTAVLLLRVGVGPSDARARLAQTDGRLRTALRTDD